MTAYPTPNVLTGAIGTSAQAINSAYAHVENNNKTLASMNQMTYGQTSQNGPSSVMMMVTRDPYKPPTVNKLPLTAMERKRTASINRINSAKLQNQPVVSAAYHR